MASRPVSNWIERHTTQDGLSDFLYDLHTRRIKEDITTFRKVIGGQTLRAPGDTVQAYDAISPPSIRDETIRNLGERDRARLACAAFLTDRKDIARSALEEPLGRTLFDIARRALSENTTLNYRGPKLNGCQMGILLLLAAGNLDQEWVKLLDGEDREIINRNDVVVSLVSDHPSIFDEGQFRAAMPRMVSNDDIPNLPAELLNDDELYAFGHDDEVLAGRIRKADRTRRSALVEYVQTLRENLDLGDSTDPAAIPFELLGFSHDHLTVTVPPSREETLRISLTRSTIVNDPRCRVGDRDYYGTFSVRTQDFESQFQYSLRQITGSATSDCPADDYERLIEPILQFEHSFLKRLLTIL